MSESSTRCPAGGEATQQRLFPAGTREEILCETLRRASLATLYRLRAESGGECQHEAEGGNHV